MDFHPLHIHAIVWIRVGKNREAEGNDRVVVRKIHPRRIPIGMPPKKNVCVLVRVETTEEGGGDEVVGEDKRGGGGGHALSQDVVIFAVEPPARVTMAGDDRRVRTEQNPL